MVEKTPRLELDDYEPGDTDWDHSDAVNALDEYAIERGPIADRPDQGDYDDELYAAIDQRILWRWDEAAADWEAIGGLGSSDQPVPGTTNLEALSTGAVDIGGDGVAKIVEGASLVDETAYSTTNTGWTNVPDRPGYHPPSDIVVQGTMSPVVRLTAQLKIQDSAETAEARLVYVDSAGNLDAITGTAISHTGDTNWTTIDSGWVEYNPSNASEPFRFFAQLTTSNSSYEARLRYASYTVGSKP